MTLIQEDVVTVEETTDSPPGVVHAYCDYLTPPKPVSLCGAILRGGEAQPDDVVCVICADLEQAPRCPRCHQRKEPGSHIDYIGRVGW